MGKKCTRCGSRKPRSEFTKNVQTKDGLNHRCRTCTRAASASYQARNPEKARAQSRAWYYANRQRKQAKNAEWKAANPGKMAAYCRAWRERNPGAQSRADASWYERNREKKLAADRARRSANLQRFLERERVSYAKFKENRKLRSAAWRKKNPARIAYHAAMRRSAIRNRTPAWLTRAELESMRKLFDDAAALKRATGVPHHVDHIVPLRGRAVSGLNVPWNLQVLPAIENLKKSNLHGA